MKAIDSIPRVIFRENNLLQSVTVYQTLAFSFLITNLLYAVGLFGLCRAPLHRRQSSIEFYLTTKRAPPFNYITFYIIERWYFQTRRCLYVASLFTCTRFLSLAGSIANNGNKQRKSHLGKRCVSPLLDIIERRNPWFVFGRGRIYLYLARSSDQDVSFAS